MATERYVVLYGIDDHYGKRCELVKVEAQVKPSTYRLASRERVFGYNTVLNHGDPRIATTPEQAWHQFLCAARDHIKKREQALLTAKQYLARGEQDYQEWIQRKA